MIYWWQMNIDERERIEFCGRIGRKGKRIGGFKVYLFKKMSQKRGMWTESTKKRLKRLEKDVIVKLIRYYLAV